MICRRRCREGINLPDSLIFFRAIIYHTESSARALWIAFFMFFAPNTARYFPESSGISYPKQGRILIVVRRDAANEVDALITESTGRSINLHLLHCAAIVFWIIFAQHFINHNPSFYSNLLITKAREERICSLCKKIYIIVKKLITQNIKWNRRRWWNFHEFLFCLQLCAVWIAVCTAGATRANAFVKRGGQVTGVTCCPATSDAPTTANAKMEPAFALKAGTVATALCVSTPFTKNHFYFLFIYWIPLWLIYKPWSFIKIFANLLSCRLKWFWYVSYIIIFMK